MVTAVTLFWMADIAAAYHQILVAESDIPKTSSSTKYGLYEYKIMPFWLKMVPEMFERLVEIALSDIQWTVCLIYLDNVIKYGKVFEKDLQQLAMVLQFR